MLQISEPFVITDHVHNCLSNVFITDLVGYFKICQNAKTALEKVVKELKLVKGVVTSNPGIDSHGDH